MATTTKSKALKEKLGVQPPSVISEWFNILIYGEWGVGKTYLSGTADDSDEFRPVLYLGSEGGVKTLAHRKNIDAKEVRSIPDIEIFHKELLMDTEQTWRTVILDTVNEIIDIDMKMILDERDNRRPDLKGEPPAQREWGICRDHMRRIIRAYRDLPMHTIFLAHSSTDRDEDIRTHAPMFPGKLQKEIPGFVDIVGFMTSDSQKNGDEIEIVRSLQFVKTKRVAAKDRTSSLGLIVENPTIPMLWELIKKGGEANAK